MPIYAYKCGDCGHEFEQRQRMSDDPLTDCPACAGQVRRVVNSVGIVFKGSGFYVTDNRNGRGSNGSSSSTTSKKSKDDDSPSTASASTEKNEPAKQKAETQA